MVTLTGFVIEQFPEIGAGETLQLENFELTPLDYEAAYINAFEVVRLVKEDSTLTE